MRRRHLCHPSVLMDPYRTAPEIGLWYVELRIPLHRAPPYTHLVSAVLGVEARNEDEAVLKAAGTRTEYEVIRVEEYKRCTEKV